MGLGRIVCGALILVITAVGIIMCKKEVMPEIKGCWKVLDPRDTRYSHLVTEFRLANLIQIEDHLIELLYRPSYRQSRLRHHIMYHLQADTIKLYSEFDKTIYGFTFCFYGPDSLCIQDAKRSLCFRRAESPIRQNNLKIDDIDSLALNINFERLHAKLQPEEHIKIDLINNKLIVMRDHCITTHRFLTPFDRKYLLEQINRIDLTKRSYERFDSDGLIYNLDIYLKEGSISISLADGQRSSLFMQALLEDLNFYGSRSRVE